MVAVLVVSVAAAQVQQPGYPVNMPAAYPGYPMPGQAPVPAQPSHLVRDLFAGTLAAVLQTATGGLTGALSGRIMDWFARKGGQNTAQGYAAPGANPYQAGAATAYPGAASAYPGSTAAYPGATAAYPGATAAYPGATAAYPGATAAYPGATAAYPGATAAYPGAAATYPGSTATAAYPGASATYPGSTDPSAGAYPGAAGQAYPSNSASAYPAATASAYPSTSMPTAAYPATTAAAGAYPTTATAGYPATSTGYPSAGTATPGYPATPSAYPAAASAYPGTVYGASTAQVYDAHTGQLVTGSANPYGMPAAATDSSIVAGIAYEVHAVSADGRETPVNTATYEFHTGDKFMVYYRPSLPGHMEIYNVNPAGQQTLIDSSNMAAGQMIGLGPYQFTNLTGDETLRLVLSPCSNPQLLAATRDIVRMDAPATAMPAGSGGLQLSSCGAPTARGLNVHTRDIQKVAVDGTTSFALDPVSQRELASGQLTPREATIVFHHR
jgi:hypothetical protein